jgi:hypothetical protein
MVAASMILRKRVAGFLLLATLGAMATAVAGPPSVLSIFSRRTVEADANADYTLSEEHGPWLILAASFGGEEGKQRARALVQELRGSYNLPAYVYHERFDFRRPADQDRGSHRQVRYANPHEYAAYAVLVGEFDSVNHPHMKKTLETIKTARPRVLETADRENEAGPVGPIRALQNRIWRAKETQPRGPMYNAFVTRNPILPDDFYSAPEVDSFVRQLNDGIEHSLLSCPGKYTVVVRTFEGNSAMVVGGNEDSFQPSGERLDRAAEDANRMCLALRKKGVEAYQFHDRFSSIVTIGSFENLGRQLPDGRFEYDGAIRQVMQTYNAGNKVTQTSNGPALIAEHVALIPFDLSPHPIAVPRAEKRSFYLGGLR